MHMRMNLSLSLPNKLLTNIAIVKRFLQRSAQEAVQQQLAGVYASLVGSPNTPDPRNIPTTATAAPATTDEVTGYYGLGIGHDDYVVEKDVEQYNEFGIVKSNLNYDDDSVFASPMRNCRLICHIIGTQMICVDKI